MAYDNNYTSLFGDNDIKYKRIKSNTKVNKILCNDRYNYDRSCDQLLRVGFTLFDLFPDITDRISSI